VAPSSSAAGQAPKKPRVIKKATACEGCGRAPEQKQWHQIETVKTSSGLHHIAVGPSCQDCHEEWEKHFWMKSWGAFVGMKAERSQCRSVGEGRKTYDHDEVLFLEDGQVVDISRKYIILNESELRSHTGQSRLRKADVASVPVVSLPPQPGEEAREDVYVFPHPDQPFREMTIRRSFGVQHQESWVQPKTRTWDRQCIEGYGYLSAQRQEQMKEKDLLTKNPGKMVTLDSLVAKVCKARAGHPDAAADGAELDGPGDAAGETQVYELDATGNLVHAFGDPAAALPAHVAMPPPALTPYHQPRHSPSYGDRMSVASSPEASPRTSPGAHHLDDVASQAGSHMSGDGDLDAEPLEGDQ
jgi:hypothetical protein